MKYLSEEQIEKMKSWCEDRFPGKGLRAMSNSFLRDNLWIGFGKYREHNIWYILETNPQYIKWICSKDELKAKLKPLLLEFLSAFFDDIKEAIDKQENSTKKISFN